MSQDSVSVRTVHNDSSRESSPGRLICDERQVNWNTSPWFLFGYYELLPDYHARYRIFDHR